MLLEFRIRASIIIFNTKESRLIRIYNCLIRLFLFDQSLLEPRREIICLRVFDQVDTNRAEQPQKMALGLKLDLGRRGIALTI